ncbi:helix-turn-helix transcriptional regulator [Mycobacterium sp. CBMA271]|uniref:TetR/AcrR family transcriptional regulator n=1 Tax=unclassified Mycobacteroides TaxID=2618759 RepID=UPI0012DEF861|nr:MULTISPECIES: TetR/AcrR family transcriptional regulator [unclassified Mycobacteroides]MUM17005.1 TetR family transcriptional regulator [Mycobacteroides sp. CBMA 326]MUM24006.1 helix-turn-helix transcriptional regulator [Mycobacteroides sp. CBMA 271]
MDQPARPLRADAARNRARVLEVAYQTFAEEGLGVPIDEIARRAGVGAGTVYRHFPAKEDLYRAVAEDRMGTVIGQGRELLESVDPGDALFEFLRSMVSWGGTDQGLVDALSGAGIDVQALIPHVEDSFYALLGDLLRAAQKAGTARSDVGVHEVKTLLVGCQAMQSYNKEVSPLVTDVVFDGLRPRK